jgi:hypothetical protein
MRIRFLAVVLLLLVAVGAFAQGVTTATLEGTVKGPDGGALPGVTVTVKSPAMMGERSTVTAVGGDYVLKGLPPGKYTVAFSLEGMSGPTLTINLPLGLTTRADAQMKVSAVTEAITVTGAAPTVLESTTVGSNIKAEAVQQLPVVRTPTGIANLAGGVTGDRGGRDGTPVAGQLSMNGGMAYDNNFLINGVNMQDNIFGNTNNLFIEDAIQETQVLTSGISAEYGHFTGGVLNVITKSGGNDFTASLRDNLTRNGWLGLTPFEKGFRGNGVATVAPTPHFGKINNIYELTAGGPVLKDRLWFFIAARREKSSTANLAAVQGVQFNVNQVNKRPEVKLSGAIAAGHSIQVDYIDNPVRRDNEVQVAPIDIAAVGHNSNRPNRGESAYYSGVLTSSLFGEARWSKKTFGFRGLGGTSTAINDSPIRSLTNYPGITAGTFNAPYFDATDPENRDNQQWFGAMSYFLSTKAMGSHDVKGGVERFVDTRTGGNSQSATGFSFFSPYKIVSNVAPLNTTPVLDSAGHLIPVFVPNSATVPLPSLIRAWFATRGAKLDTTTDSLFFNDRWNLNSYFTFNLGARYEKAKSEATGDIIPIDTSNFVPRLGASYDVKGNGRYKIDVTYAQYVGRYNPALAGAETPVGNPAVLSGYYIGPAGEGRNFAPGFDPKNYVFYTASVPTANVFVASGMHAPVSTETTLSGGMQLPKNGWMKATFTDRKYSDFIEDFFDNPTASGCTNIILGGINAGCADNRYYRNSNAPKRHYQAMEIQSHYDVSRNWGFEGNITHQFKNDGNFEGEAGQAIGASGVGDRPEMQSPREITVGHLAQYEENKLRLWTTYNFNLHRFGNLSAGVLYRYDSPLTFSYQAAVTRSTAAACVGVANCKSSVERNPGYKSAANGAGSVTLFFGDRGAGTFNSTSLFDTSLQYSVPIAGKITPWVKFDVRNVFNKDTLLTYNTAITADANSPKDEFGYRTGFTKNATFGRPSGATSYVRPREYLVYVGLRY